MLLRNRRSPIKLNDTHLILLTTASQRENGSLIPLPESLGQAADRVRKAVAALLKNGLVEEGEVSNAARAWRQNGDMHIGVRITPTGLKAIGIEPLGTPAGIEPEAARHTRPRWARFLRCSSGTRARRSKS